MRLRRLKKWIKMFSGKGTLHVKKEKGHNWSRTEVKGFYIDYSGKLSTTQFTEDGLPYSKLENNEIAVLPITVIQYGLGCYETMLEGDTSYRDAFFRCSDYMLKTQALDGSWEAFAAQKSDYTKSSMVQGEGAALLIRAYIESGDEDYLSGAKKACSFMLVDYRQGGTAEYGDGYIGLLEGTSVPLILNGAIYSLFGLLDLFLITKDEMIKTQLDLSLAGIKHYLPQFDSGYWSYYCLDKRLASPFYHQLHITQLEVLYELFNDEVYLDMHNRFMTYYQNRLYYTRAFTQKAIQKLTEKKNSLAIIE